MFIMGVKEMASYIGKVGQLKLDSFLIAVEISDIRKVWQRIDVLVSPVHGNGEQWVCLDRVVL
jgi:hypothetical protein